MNGLSIEGRSIEHIGRVAGEAVQEYFSKHFSKSPGDDLFAESVRLQFEELSHTIPGYLLPFFDKNDWFTCHSGELEVPGQDGFSYVISAVADETCSKLFLILVQQIDESTGEDSYILLKEYLSGK